MLKLEKLEMIGFKSFLSRTEFQFHEGITAVVGPNGCGKSNIGDALNWVIGEQSVKSLRGERMEDVIFNGSEARKPLGMAEVSLHLRNGQPGPEGACTPEQVVISRRLFRSGESEYLINGERSRLRDIQELLVSLNVGSGLYSIIEQGKVDAALSSRPRDRRALIEEAAGVALYKTRRRQAETRLEATEANLLRVNDIVREIEKQVGSLKRQAARARRHGRLTEEIARHDRILMFHEHRRLDGERAQVDAREQVARDAESQAAGRLAGLEAAGEEGLRRLEEEDTRWRCQRDALHDAQRRIDAQERERDLARQQAEEAQVARDAARGQAALLAARLEEVGRQLEFRRADREGLEQRLASEEARRAQLEEDLRSQEERIGALEADLTGARADFVQVVDAQSEARNRRRHVEELLHTSSRREEVLGREESAARDDLARSEQANAGAEALVTAAEADRATIQASLAAREADIGRLDAALAREIARRDETRRKLHVQDERLRTLQEVEAAPGGTRDRLSALCAREDLHDQAAGFARWWRSRAASGLLADELRAREGMEAAADAYLRDFLEAALVESGDDALAGVAALKRTGAGRAAFLPAPGGADDAPAIRLPDEVAADAGFVGRLSDLVETDPLRRAAIRAALVRAVVVTDLAAADRLRRLAPFFDYITLDGDIVRISGLIEGGARVSEAAGVLTRRRQMQDLRIALETGRAHLAGLETLVGGLGVDRSAAEAARAGLADALARREKDLVALRLNAQSAAEETGRILLRTRTVASEKGAAGEEGRTLRVESERLGATLIDLEEARARAEARIAGLQDETTQRRAAAAGLNEEHASVRASVSASAQRLEAFDIDLARLLESDRDLRDRLDAETRRGEVSAQRQAESLKRHEEAGAALVDLGRVSETLSAAVREGEVALSEMRLQMEQAAQEVRAARGHLDAARAARESITLERERVAGDLRHLESSVPPSAGGLAQLLATLTEEERLLAPDAVAEALADLKRRLEQIGPVNMMALDQFRELEERHIFLSAQRKDLQDALASLKETIARINRTSRERFLETFEAVRAGFQETFRSLFGGGRADLRLMTEEDEDVLDCGLEIVAQPPGKRVGSITLMSGGEKALTAVALLFAIFRYKPSPFCLLDEVDAPLDELNVIRFNEMLRTMAISTQFVMITHNRTSMETADMLYGITMEEPGVSRTMSVVLGGAEERARTVRSLPALLAARHKGSAGRPGLAAPRSGSNGGIGTNGAGARTDSPA